MKKMSINDAAEYFGVSKEAIHNRIRRGSIEAVLENGVKMVILNSNIKPSNRVSSRSKLPLSNDMYYKLLEEQNTKLNARVELLESETRVLRDQKELMLIQEMEKIEQIYKDKDEQLKNILHTLSSQFMLSSSREESSETVEVEIEDIEKNAPVSLKKYLKSSDYSDKKIIKIIKRFQKSAKDDERIVLIGKKYYIDVANYDYSDLIR